MNTVKTLENGNIEMKYPMSVEAISVESVSIIYKKIPRKDLAIDMSFVSGKIEDAMKCSDRGNVNILLSSALSHIDNILRKDRIPEPKEKK